MSKLPTLAEERKLWKCGVKLVVGVDEAGRGSFAGPIVASAVALAPKLEVRSGKLEVVIDDSKRLKAREREKASDWIKKNCLAYGIGEIGVATINKVGIGKATAQAMRLAIAKLLNGAIANNCFVFVDAFHVKYLRGVGLKNQKAIKKGDQKSLTIAAASIIAKVYRDNLMRRLAKKYPSYKWGRNKGYGTRAHQEAIKKNGITRLHRKTFIDTFLSH